MKYFKNFFINISFIYFFFSITILFYLLYRSFFVDESYNGAFYNKYYVITSILILISSISYFLVIN